MSQKILPEERAFLWKTKGKEIKIKNLDELLAVLLKIKQEDIDKEIKKNIDKLIGWLEVNFSEQVELLAHLKKEKYTPQQVRERLVRDLRKIVKS